MVARKKVRPETGKAEREFIEREDGGQQIPPTAIRIASTPRRPPVFSEPAR